MSRHVRISAAFAATLVALVFVPALAGCGGNAASSSSPAATQSGAAGSAPTTYLEQAQQILAQVGTTSGALPGAVAGLSKDTQETAAWTDSGNKLNDIAGQLETEASSLAALTPPGALKPVQDAVVKGIRTTSASVKDLANLIYEQSATEAEAHGSIQSQVDGMKTKLLALSAKLTGAIDRLGTPTP